MADEAKPRKKKGNVIVWVILGLLVLSLGGFGIGGFGGEIRTVAEVGDEEVLTADYARALQEEQQQFSQQAGQALTLEQLRLFGRDRLVMDRLLAAAALAHETGEVGLSVGDAEVAERIRTNPGFQGVSGDFDREGYAFALRQAGLNERAFEERVRSDAAREILQAAVVGGVAAPAGYAERMVDWLGETRDATVAQVTSAQLDAGPTAPTEAQLETFLQENAETFQVPERRRITYAWASPDVVAETVEVEREQIEAAYEARADEYRLPARVLAERLAFADTEAATSARAALDAGETTFDALVENRGLALEDVDQGELSADDLDAAIAEALFALEEPGIAGPVETALGPTLYRVNAILDARVTPIEDVSVELAREVATDAARRHIDAARDDIDDLLAGGATLEEIAGETDMVLGEIAWDPSVSEGIAGYEAFRSAAAEVAEGDFPELTEMADGGLFALRLDAIEPATLPPLDEIRARVEAAWQSDSLRTRLADRAAELAERIEAGESFEDVGLAPESVTGIARDGGIADAPRDLVDAIFEAEAGALLAEAADAQRAYVIRVDGATAPDMDDPEIAATLQAVRTQTRQEIMADLFQAYGTATQAAAGYSVNAQAVQAVEAQLLGGHGGM